MSDVSLRARATDPLTSWAAADRAEAFAGSHRARIVKALRSGDMTAREISAVIGLTVVQIDRRLPELQRDKVAAIAKENGADLMRDGYRVWTLVPQDEQRD